MKKLLLLAFVSLFLYSCNTKKHVEVAMNSGNYDQAINTAIGKLRTNKHKKRNMEYIGMLQESFHKASARDQKTISHLKKDNNPELYRKIYETYISLDSRQRKIQPLLPLMIEGKKVPFRFKDYSDEIIVSKNKLTRHLYDQANALLGSNNKSDIRAAYRTFSYLEKINPNYSDTRELLEEAHYLGQDHVFVEINNNSDILMPARLEDELLEMNIYDQKDFWSVYHTNFDEDHNYDYALQLNLNHIAVSPERLREREFTREKEIIDGWKYQLDTNGNVAKDSLGNDIKIDNIIKVKCNVLESVQLKSSQVQAEIVYIDLAADRVLDKFDLESNFIFENVYARINGDKRALSKEDELLLNSRRLPFPSDEQMVYDTGEDLKRKLRNIIRSYRIH
ncbi:hypothetical protein [Christiangramia salexigens]|uniref:Lipoprotein n=1 Tax=Christiangramia salexigens TaxID=1913577 RepID=A0A1L3J452_9FLAO|nr:hypothetical protein [Christiangramia salexigens]APG59883.1 hypothetical protein LPB144_05395 [Christiangramia salexigens]